MAKLARLQPASSLGPPEFFEEVEQLGDEWFALRLGIPTASCFSCVVRDADAKTRKDYLYLLAGEILSGRPGEHKTLTTAAMERGREMEPRALEEYGRKHVVELERVGFVRRKLPSGRYVGCSPDSLVVEKKRRVRAVEIKTMSPRRMCERLHSGAGMPPEHRWQCIGTAWLCDLPATDLMVYHDGMPFSPEWTLQPNAADLQEIANAVEVFDHELHRLVADLRAKGRAFG